MKIDHLTDSVTLNNGVKMPWLGLGVFKVKEGEEVESSVRYALKVGYRHIDTAALYANEEGVGKAIRESGVPREEIFVTTKVWNDDIRSGDIEQAFEASLRKLQMDYIDLYLIHWPVKGHYVNAWKKMEKLYQGGKVRSVGVSNFLIHHLEDLRQESNLIPAVNQVEYHPRVVQQDLVDYCQKHGIVFEAWAPLMQGHFMEIPLFAQLAEKYRKTAAQIILRWDLQHGVVTIPKSIRPARIDENKDIFDFEISPEDMHLIDQLDQDKRIGPDPDHFDF